MKYTIYLLRCKNNSLYCGYTNNLSQRINQHVNQKSGAKYTKAFPPIAIAAAWELDCEKGAVLKLEYTIKQLDKKQKEKLITTDYMLQLISYLEAEIKSIGFIDAGILRQIWLDIN